MHIREVNRTFLVPGKTLDGQGDVDHAVTVAIRVESTHLEAASFVASSLGNALAQDEVRKQFQPKDEPKPKKAEDKKAEK